MRTAPLAIASALVLLLTACGTQVADPGASGSGGAAPTTGTGAAGMPPGATATPAGGGSSSAAKSGPPSAKATSGTGEFIAAATVLEKKGEGPQLCLGGVAGSLPPQCGGPVIDNWDWATAPKSETAAGVRWGEYLVVGTYDAAASTFHLTKPATTREEYDGPLPTAPPDAMFTTPCPVPEGGWRVVDPAKATRAAQDAALEAAAKLPTYAAAWLDQSINPADPEKQPEAMNDPVKLILNVKVTTDAAGAEKQLREIWGGMLCVSEGGHPEAELRKIQEELSGKHGMLFSAVDGQTSTVEFGVIWDDGSLQKAMDAAYGLGVVHVTSALQPYPG